MGASYLVGRLPDEGDVQIEWMTGVLCNGLICQQVSSKKELNILPCVLPKDTFFLFETFIDRIKKICCRITEAQIRF